MHFLLLFTHSFIDGIRIICFHFFCSAVKRKQNGAWSSENPITSKGTRKSSEDEETIRTQCNGPKESSTKGVGDQLCCMQGKCFTQTFNQFQIRKPWHANFCFILLNSASVSNARSKNIQATLREQASEE